MDFTTHDLAVYRSHYYHGRPQVVQNGHSPPRNWD